MRVALYARYSSDQQRAASIADQLRTCREFAVGQGWTVVREYHDEAISGASLMREGIQSLMRDARGGQFDIVLAEALDRLSRDQADIAVLYRQLKFEGVLVFTPGDGQNGPLHIALKGVMNEQYLVDLADKTRRGLRGRVEEGRSGGGLCYGYRVARSMDEPGGREIHPGEASVVRRIFSNYAEGVSPQALCKALNAEGVTGPRGAAWSPSTIHGNAKRGTGILNNELYIGRIVWNRLRYVKNPETGNRISRMNPSSAWITKNVPDLRIVDETLWAAVKARQADTRHTTGNEVRSLVQARRPKHLFSELTKCAVCGGGFTSSSRDQLRCFNATARGTCSNRRSIKRQELEARVLRAMQERFFESGAFAAFCEGFIAEWHRVRGEHIAAMAGARRELTTVQNRMRKLVQAIEDGVSVSVVKDQLQHLEDRKFELSRALVEPPPPALHPNMAEVFRQKAIALADGLQRDEKRAAAREALRGFVERILIPPGDELMTVVGKLGAMLDAAAGPEMPGRPAVAIVGCGGRI